MKLEYVIEEKDYDMMVKDIVKKRMKISSRLYTKISKDIYLNDDKCYTSSRVKIGDKVIVDLDGAYENLENMYDKFNEWKHELDVIYEDEYILCVNKEKGVPCHPSAMHQERTLYNAIIHYYMKKNIIVPIHFVNRLDKDTTGLVIIAKHKYVQEFLSKQMQNGNLIKKYIAVVYGKIEEKEGVIEKRIKRKENSIILREVTDDISADYAKTGYKVLGYNNEKNYTIVEITLYTGRTHQIRVHFASLGHPLLGDELYARECNINAYKTCEEIDRQALHAKEVSFLHLNKQNMVLKAEEPKDIKSLVSSVEKFT